ncbi:hybrid sensor histidine kinase/response regulator [Dyella sp.]|uniref:hybrid sensor histidine kinase/response regulator n=1 Tax=Dyella sp. TaxID=1869338 RepID=UPI002ECFB557
MFFDCLAGMLMAVATFVPISSKEEVPATVTKFAEPMPAPYFRRFGDISGLHGTLNAIVQDSEGFIWFGGTRGLARYDGVDFESFIHDPLNDNSLASSRVAQLLATHDGRLWIGTADSGLDLFDPKSRTFRHWRHQDDDQASLSNNSVLALAPAVDGGVWVGTADGLNRLLPDGAVQREPMPSESRLPEDQTVSALMVERDGSMWLGTGSGKVFIRRPDGAWLRVEMPFLPLSIGEIRDIDGHGDDIRISTRHGLFIANSQGQARPAFRQTQMPASFQVFASLRDDKERLWMATLDGVIMEDERSRLHRFNGKPSVPGALPGDWVLGLLRDREGGLWFTFYEGGAAYLPPHWEGFSRYPSIPERDPSAIDDPPKVVASSIDGKLWVGRQGRLDKFDPVTGQNETVVGDLKQPVMYVVDVGGEPWFTVRGELLRFRHGRVENIDPHRHWITRPEMLTRGDDGTVYVTVARHGIVQVDPITLDIHPVPFATGVTNMDLQPSVLSMHDGQLWYGNHDGLMRWQYSKGPMDWVPGVGLGRPVTALAFGDNGFWLARGRELERYRWEKDKAVPVMSLTPQAAWRNAVITDLDVDASNNLWVFSSSGIWNLDGSRGTLRRVEAGNEPVDGATGPGAPGFGQNNEPRYVPTRNGLIGFRPSHVSPETAYRPPLRFTELSVSDREGRTELIPENGRITLSWSLRTLKIKTRLLSFASHASTHYRIRIEGVSHGWIDLGVRGEYLLGGLKPGLYLLEAEAFDPNRDVLGATSVWVQLESPPWVRWWAWLAYAVIIIGFGYAALWAWQRRVADRHRIRLAEERHELAEQTSAAKTQFLATLGHEIRTPMTGVIGMAELLLGTSLTEKQREYTLAMQRSGALLLKLVNEALDLARIEAGRFELEPATFEVSELIEDISRLEMFQARKKGLAFEVEALSGLPPRLVGDVLRIKQILLNLANNALKFTDRGKVTLRIEYDAPDIVFHVIDTGPGIPLESQERMFQRFEQGIGPQRQQGSGLGLAICQELVTLMNGRIELQSVTGVGSHFRVFLPLPEPVRDLLVESGEFVSEPSEALSLLLVEDDPVVADVIIGLLESLGHSVQPVGNGLAALAELTQSDFDAVLLDLDLPGLSGFDVAKIIRQRESEGERIPIIAVTARSAADDEHNAHAAGMDGFVRKPLNGKDLSIALAALNRLRRAA